MAPKSKKSPRRTAEQRGDRLLVENVNHPGKSRSVDAAKYRAAKAALMKVLPKREPGLTDVEQIAAVRRALPPGDHRTKAGWWTKTVQVDLEAKGMIRRNGRSPLRWRRA